MFQRLACESGVGWWVTVECVQWAARCEPELATVGGIEAAELLSLEA
jgi:hypothetical protein